MDIIRELLLIYSKCFKEDYTKEEIGEEIQDLIARITKLSAKLW